MKLAYRLTKLTLILKFTFSRVDRSLDLYGLLGLIGIDVGEVRLSGESVLGTRSGNSLLGFVDVSLSNVSISVICPHGVGSQVLSSSVNLWEERLKTM